MPLGDILFLGGYTSGGVYIPCIYSHMRRRLKSLLLCLCYFFLALINYLVCWFCYERGQGCHSVALIPFPSALCAERGFSIL